MTAKPGNHTIRLVFIGDIALGESPSSVGLGVSRYLGASMYRQWHDYLSGFNGNFVIANFEGTISEGSQYPKNHILRCSMRISPESAGPLGASGISHVSLANNHSNDHGPRAMQSSMSFVRSQGIVAMEHFWRTGNVYEIRGDNFKIGMIALNFVDKTMGRSDESLAISPKDIPELVARIKEHRPRVDHLIISVHWGENYGLWPNDLQLTLANEFVRAGASAVIGHHPHNIQKVRHIDDVPVVFSLGSFCFENKSPVTRLGQIAILDLTRSAVSLVCNRYISVGKDYTVREELSWIQRRIVLMVDNTPSKALNYVFVRTVRIWILTVSLFRALRAGNLRHYMRWVKYRYAKPRP